MYEEYLSFMKFVAGTDFFLLLHFAENFRALCTGILLP
jgi:hypothetical protein